MARPTLRWGFLAEVRTARLGLLKERNFRLFYAGYATSLFGTGMAPVGVAFAVLDSGGSAAGLGLVLTAGVVAQILTLLAGGVAAGFGLIGRRPARPLVVCHLVAAGWALPLAGLALGLPAPVVAPGPCGSSPEA
ncbi:MAG TPA: hypothetical protein VHY58_25130 [Streptosporangiaceae bacterium]|nr:hypothetical protein [Streptosporangiaceae bacterium]